VAKTPAAEAPAAETVAPEPEPVEPKVDDGAAPGAKPEESA
jgi:hypothetical protein